MNVVGMSQALAEKLRQALPPAAFIDNPIDISAGRPSPAITPKPLILPWKTAPSMPFWWCSAPQYMTQPAATVRAIVAPSG